MKLLIAGDCRFDHPFGQAVAAIPGLVGSPDAFIMNAETGVATNQTRPAMKSVCILAELEDVDRVCNAITCPLVINVANNHSGDAGPQAFEEWMAHMRRRGVQVLGTGEPVILTGPQGERVGLLSYGGGSMSGKLASYRDRNVSAEVSSLAQNIDAVVVMMHWGEEYIFTHSPYQETLSQQCLEAGARLVVGCHPHVLQGVRRTDRGDVFFSLGNTAFRAGPTWPGTGIGGILEANISRAGAQNNLHCTVCDEEGGMKLLAPDAQESLAGLFEKLGRGCSSLQWYRQGCRAFFGNHLRSWQQRIAKYGFLEFLRMGKAFLTPYYLCMFGGYFLGGAFSKLNDHTAQQIDTWASRQKADPKP